MPSARQPIIVEVRPDSVSPSPPASPSKAVRFPAPSEIVAGITRPLRPVEAWSLYHFETHARKCSACHRPYHTISNGGQLCDEGRSLAYDVNMHVYHRDGQVYSTIPEEQRDIRVEIPHGYDQIIGLLKGIDRRQHKKARKPAFSYETRAPAVQPVYETTTIPTRSRSHRETKYDTIVVGRDDDDKRSRRYDEKRGSLSKENVQPRPRKVYVIEVRAPEDYQRRRHRDVYV